MKELIVLTVAGVLTPIARARVWTTVYQYDGKTPLAAVDVNHPDVYRDIMVGTRLTLVISSDTSDSWSGDLRLSRSDWSYGTLSGRGFIYVYPRPGNPLKIPTYKGSCLDAAGTNATAMAFGDSYWVGLSFNNDVFPYRTGGHPAYPGDWFVVDYHAEQAGNCKVEFRGNDPIKVVGPGVDPGPIPQHVLQTLSFTHVPARDFNGDAGVDFKDFALLASHWRGAPDPNSPPQAAFDLNGDGQVDTADLALFGAYWLARTDSSVLPAPSDSAAQP